MTASTQRAALVVEADGGSRGNPGPAGYGAVVKDADGQVLAELAEAIGTTTNNVAEYRGLLAGLDAALRIGGEGTAVEVRMDSKLVIEQMAGRWKVKHEGLRPLASQAAGLARRLRVTWKWVPRERNSHADRLANEAMDAAAKGLPAPSGSTLTGSVPPGAASSAPTADRSAASRPVASPAAPPAEPSADPLTGAAHAGAGTVPATSGAADAAPGRAARPSSAATGTGWRGPVTAGTVLLLLRHGETPLSVERRFSGLGEVELTPNGRAQAERAAQRLAREPYSIDVIVSSPRKRARATAEIVAARLGVPVEVEEGLRETDFGAWEGHTFTEIQRRWPQELAAWLADPSVAPPGGESFAHSARRVEETRQRILAEHAGKTILAVSHVTPIKLLLCSALEAPPPRCTGCTWTWPACRRSSTTATVQRW